MADIVVIVDDFTGALDTGVKLSFAGIKTQITQNCHFDYNAIDSVYDAVVFDTESRHSSRNEAYHKVFSIAAEAAKAGVRIIYKKTDSALRGNIGAELDAVYKASGLDNLFFIPAYPEMGRTTLNGIHYINGIPVAESIFAQDPFNPVNQSNVEDIIHQQTNTVCTILKPGQKAENKGIIIYDAVRKEDMTKIADSLSANRHIAIGGCAGFASVIPSLLRIAKKTNEKTVLNSHMLIICGSINPISVIQCDTAENKGIPRIRLQSSILSETDKKINEICEKIESLLTSSCIVITDTSEIEAMDSDRKTPDYGNASSLIQIMLARLIKQFYNRNPNKSIDILIMGGDVLFALMKELDVTNIKPVTEMYPGVVLSKIFYAGRERNLLSKSGGFGPPDLFIKLKSHMQDIQNRREINE